MATAGEIRFAGASFYRDPSLNAAIRDDELGLAIFPQNGVLDLSRCGIRGIPSERVPGGVVLRHPTDFYVQCFSGRFALRSFNDFDADACLIVYDAPELFRRLEAPLKNRFPDWSVGTVPVHYVDPDDPPTQPLPLPALKSLRYAYQAEVRVVCHPKQGVYPRLDPIFINIKPLGDIAEIITLSSGIR